MKRRATGEIDLDGRVPALYEELADFAKCAVWLPGIDGAEILAGEGDVSIVELSLPERKLVLEVVATPPRSIAFQQVDRAPGRGISGAWKLSEGEQGTVRLEAWIQAKVKLRDIGAGRRLRQGLDGALQAADRRFSTKAAPEVPPDHRKIFEVVRRGATLEVRIGNEVIEVE